MSRKYLPTLAELVDRLSIAQLKEVFITDHKNEYAQEIKDILPDVVKTESTGVMRVDASNITWYLVNAIKELSTKVAALEAG